MGFKSNLIIYTMTLWKRGTVLWKAEGKKQRQRTNIRVQVEINHPSPLSIPCLIMETNTLLPLSPFLSVYFYVTENKMTNAQYPVPLGCVMVHTDWRHWLQMAYTTVMKCVVAMYLHQICSLPPLPHLCVCCSSSLFTGDFLGLQDVYSEGPGGEVISKACLNGATPHQQCLAHCAVLPTLLPHKL